MTFAATAQPTAATTQLKASTLVEAAAPTGSAAANVTADINTLINTEVFVAPARFDVHATDRLTEFASLAFSANNHLVIDLRMVEFLDEHIYDTLGDIARQAASTGVTCVVAELSPAAALTLDFLSRAAA